MSKASKNRINVTLERLETELNHLKHKFQSGQELKLEWMPNNGPKSGEVVGTTIRIYESDQAKAIDTLRHEFVEYLLDPRSCGSLQAADQQAHLTVRGGDVRPKGEAG